MGPDSQRRWLEWNTPKYCCLSIFSIRSVKKTYSEQEMLLLVYQNVEFTKNNLSWEQKLHDSKSLLWAVPKCGWLRNAWNNMDSIKVSLSHQDMDSGSMRGFWENLKKPYFAHAFLETLKHRLSSAYMFYNAFHLSDLVQMSFLVS